MLVYGFKIICGSEKKLGECDSLLFDSATISFNLNLYIILFSYSSIIWLLLYSDNGVSKKSVSLSYILAFFFYN